MQPLKIALDAEDFLCLVRGGNLIVKCRSGKEVHIILRDIGFHHMYALIERVEKGKEETYKNRERPSDETDLTTWMDEHEKQ
jgi:hypothetical protein